MAALDEGQRVAIVSDAGHAADLRPRLPAGARGAAAGAKVFPIPGASALLAGLSAAGLPTDRFLFVGFPPPKSAARRTFLAELAGVRATLVFFEGGSRLADSLADMAAVLGGDREAVVCRELTKLYETFYRGPLGDPGRPPEAGRAQGRDRDPGGPGPRDRGHRRRRRRRPGRRARAA